MELSSKIMELVLKELTENPQEYDLNAGEPLDTATIIHATLEAVRDGLWLLHLPDELPETVDGVDIPRIEVDHDEVTYVCRELALL